MPYSRLFSICFALVVFSLIFPLSAWAYLDPGTGSYVFQLLIAGLAASIFAIKIYWRKLGAFFTNSFSKKKRGKDGNQPIDG